MGLRGNRARLIELIGGDQDARIADADGVARSRLLNPALNPCLASTLLVYLPAPVHWSLHSHSSVFQV
jgi:hypothetical protein